MLWLVTINDIQIPVRAVSEQALMDQLEDMLAMPLATLNLNMQQLPDMAEFLASSEIALFSVY